MSDRNTKSPDLEQGFLSRWSLRKRKAEAVLSPHVPADDKADLPISGAASERDSEPDSSVPLPPLDTLDEQSDYSAFFSPQVSDELRRLALRKLFSGSRFNVRDGLDDYDEDYRHFEALGDTVTAEMRYRMERLQTSEEEPPSLAEASAGESEAERREPPIPVAEETSPVVSPESSPDHSQDDTTET